MKRYYFFFCALAIVVLGFNPCASAEVWENSFHKFNNSVLAVASKITAQQKPVLQDSSINDEEMQEFGYPPVSYGRLWQNSKNCVAFSYITAWKGATLIYFETSDSSLTFAGNIKIGSSKKALEKFFAYKFQGSSLEFQLDGETLLFKLQNGKISKILLTGFENGSGVPEKIFNIVKPRFDSIYNSEEEISDFSDELDEITKEFIQREKIPHSVLDSGEIYVLKSYSSQFKATKGNGVRIFSEPNSNSKLIMTLNNGAKLIADAEWTGKSGEDWYFVHFSNKAKGWINSKFIVEREPD